MTHLRRIAIPLLLITAILLVSCNSEAPTQDSPSKEVGQAAIALADGVPPRPDSPADPNGDYRADSALQVGANGKPQLIEFFAYWCTTCRAMKPIVHGLEAEYWGRVDFVYLDIDNPENDGIKQAYNYRAQPTFVLVSPDGTEIQQWYGYIAEDELSQAIDDYLHSQS